MNISSVQSYNAHYTGRQAQIPDLKEIKPASADKKEISKNSLPELLGRYQVSFSGMNKTTGPVFEHDCSEFMGPKEHIEYNKENGSFIHTVYLKDGVTLTKQEEFYPLQRKEVITKRRDDGSIEKTTKIENVGTKREITDSDGRQTYLSVTDAKTGNREIVETDYKKQRKITTKILQDGRKPVSVIDLNTQQPVYSGPLAESTYFDADKNTYTTFNIVTGQTLAVKRCKSNNTLLSLTEYYEGSGVVSRKKNFDKKTGGYIDVLYYETGRRKSVTTTTKNNLQKETIEYLKDGETEDKHTLETFDRYGSIISHTDFYPNTTRIKEYTEYDDNEHTTYHYRKSPNIVEYAETYQFNKLVLETSYDRDGETIVHERHHNEDGSYKEIFYANNGSPRIVKYYTADNYLYSENEYDKNTGARIRTLEYDYKTNSSKETLYDEDTENVSRIIIRDENNNYKEIINFYLDGNTPKTRYSFEKDGSYTRTEYNELGQPTQSVQYNADGTRKVNNKRQESSSSQINVIEFLKQIAGTLGYENGISNISDRDFIKLAKILGVEDYTQLKPLRDNDIYKKLVRQYHPDLNKPENAELCHILITIINNLREA